MAGPLIVILILGVVGMIFAFLFSDTAVPPERKTNEQRIEELGIGSLIIKQSSVKGGLLILTWDELVFLGDESSERCTLSQIRSAEAIASELVLIIDGRERRFLWPIVKNSSTGVGFTGSGMGVGGLISRSSNPSPQQWAMLLDDLRFGRIKRPS